MHIFLILYLWHGDSSGNSSIGGPSISVSAMPSVAVCEQVGAATKRLADEQIKAAARPSQCDGFLRDTSKPCVVEHVIAGVNPMNGHWWWAAGWREAACHAL